MDKEVLEVFEKGHSGYKLELSEPPEYQWSADMGPGSISTSTETNSSKIRERTIKLPETHIFTPVKGTSPVAREVTSREDSPLPDDPYFPKGSITVKEYHDVEYSLEPIKRSDNENEFEEFQSAQLTDIPPLALNPTSLLEPQKVETAIPNDIMWPEPGKVVLTESSELDFLGTQTFVLQQYNRTLDLNTNTPAPPPTAVLSKKDFTYSKQIFGISPTEQNSVTEEEDFNDFQAAPTPTPLAPHVPEPKKVQLSDPITLSPARLVASAENQSNQTSTWISSFDNDEISRIEAAFPKCKPERKEMSKPQEEDDWTDFVGAAQPNFAPSTISSKTISNSTRISNGDFDDDWNDFVGAAQSTSQSIGVSSSQLQSRPNFSSWNQPIIKPYVNHQTSFLSNDSGSYVTEKLSRSSITITNNFNYSSNNAPSGIAPRRVSTILPELNFAMPKNLINFPRGGQMDPGKK